ncbi:fimbrial biogenesis chaperone [Pantoea anthophila]|uniref:fimbrial biogenesis chaperone n=1 Tax=Pantoea anthophila TaxID=470931 RepID=UPI00277E434C|nr:molecular chaperone [Pantoea anthophila]MDQ1211094.1 chaperone protein EcpD [Pantoea anthophila]
MRHMVHLFSVVFMFISLGVHATVVPLQDRVLFSSTDSDRRLLIVNNDGQAPVLLQSWIDDGATGDMNKEKNYPFVVIPAVARMAPGKVLNLKILPTEKISELPTDRESVFWINLYEIPGVKQTKQSHHINKIEVGLNSQLKIIYRPFKEAMNINTTGESIGLRLTDGGRTLEITNPTPYYITPVSVKVNSPDAGQPVTLGMDRLIAPFSHKRFKLSEAVNSKKTPVEYTIVDDVGKNASFIKVLN